MNKKRRRPRASRKFIAASMCVLIGVAAASAFLVIRSRNANSPQGQAKWNSISNVRIDFSTMVTNREFTVGSEGDPVKAELGLKEMYFHENDFVLPFKGRVSCSAGTADCSMEIRAPVRFEQGRVYAGELRPATFASHGLDLGADEKFVAATLFGMVKGKIEILPLEVDREFKAIHSINNDFIEFEK